MWAAILAETAAPSHASCIDEYFGVPGAAGAPLFAGNQSGPRHEIGRHRVKIADLPRNLRASQRSDKEPQSRGFAEESAVDDHRIEGGAQHGHALARHSRGYQKKPPELRRPEQKVIHLSIPGIVKEIAGKWHVRVEPVDERRGKANQHVDLVLAQPVIRHGGPATAFAVDLTLLDCQPFGGTAGIALDLLDLHPEEV